LTAPGNAISGDTYQIGARVQALNGETGELTAPITAIVTAATDDNSVPTIMLQAPTTAIEGETIVIAALAEDGEDMPAVEFYVDHQLVGVDYQPPYEWLYQLSRVTQNKSIVIEAHAVDSVGHVSGDSQSLQILNDVTPPSPPLFLAPAANEQVVAGTQIMVAVNAVDNLGVAKVMFNVNDVPAGEDSVAPYNFNYLAPVNLVGTTTVTISAHAVDYAGQVSDPRHVSFSIVADVPPAIVIQTPTTNGNYIEQTDLLINLQVTDDVQVLNVTIRLDGVIIASMAAPPYHASVAQGAVEQTETHILEAVATDSNFQSRVAQREFHVVPDSPPVIADVTPTANTEHSRGTVLELAGTVTDDIAIAAPASMGLSSRPVSG
jgi:hypothetical protein